MTTTYYAAIDATNPSGAVYGVGTTPEAALAQALEPGDPCVGHDDRGGDHGPEDHFAIVRCTPAAAAWVGGRGGAPDPALSVSRNGVCLRREEE